jgi:putative ABC transport system ATP-binding protein
MFQLTDVSKHYGHKQGQVAALRSTTLKIAAGEFVAVVGPSGSGKTTLLSILGGMLAPTSGRVLLDGQSLYDVSPSQRAETRLQRIGFVFQTFNLVPYLTAIENVQIPLMLRRNASAVQELRATELLKRVGLDGRMHHKPSELSVGQQQRVALARTLANDPPVILADEPTGNLDPSTREHVLNFLEDLCREGRTVVMVTHDPAAAERAGRVLQLADGAVKADSQNNTRRVA